MVDQRRDEQGAVATEYALMAGLIAVVIVGGVTLFGGVVQALFQLAVTNWP